MNVRRLLWSIPSLFLGFSILFISVLRTAAVKPDFVLANGPTSQISPQSDININYELVYPGRVLPDNPLWIVKASRDRLWLSITTNSGRKAELKLLFADKRLAMAQELFNAKKYDIGFTTLSKAEKYLEEASLQEQLNRARGMQTQEFLKTLAISALKHRQVVRELTIIAPQDALPEMVKIEDYSKKVYEESVHALNEKAIDAPQNPFDSR